MLNVFLIGQKRIAKLILILVLLFVYRSLYSQVIIDGGTDTETPYPTYVYYNYSYSQSIYTQANINTVGTINKLYYKWDGSAAVSRTVQIFMKHTTKSSFSSSTDWESINTTTDKVFDGTINLTTTAGWVEITLTTPFSYNNTNNLIIAFDDNTGSCIGSGSNFTSHAYTNGTIYANNDFSNFNPASPPTSGTIRTSYVPDIKLDIQQVPMTFTSSTCTQNNSSNVSIGASNSELIGVQVVMSSGTPVNITNFVLNMTGTTSIADVTNIDIYYTGTSSTFATTTLFGSVAPSAGNLSVNGTTALASGTNYFWIVYDLSPTSISGNYIDAECTQITVNSLNYTPSGNPPSGRRMIASIINLLSGTNTATTCNALFYDNGGTANYSDNFSGIYTFYPSSASNKIKAIFNSFDTESGWDFLRIYDGNSTAATLIGTYSGTQITAGQTFQSTASDGSLTFYFTSDASSNRTGWTAQILCAENMSYVSSTTTQNTSELTRGETDMDVIKLQINTTGDLNPINISQIQVNMTGTNAITDVDNVKIYYTGNSSTFCTSTLFGSATPATGTININGSANLVSGANYFWVAYDINSTAVYLNDVDAECVGFGSSAKVTRVPTITAPTGSRLITKFFPINVATKVNSCYGVFWDAGIRANYSLNESYVKTFCATETTKCISILFDEFTTEATYDKLEVFDGKTTGSPLITSLSGSSIPGAVVSTDSCLTFRFTSDVAFPEKGWKARINCVNKPTCSGNDPASDICGSATVIDNIAGFCGNTSSTYTPDEMPMFCAGSIDNSSWFTFTADSTIAEFYVFVNNCVNHDGIQAEFYETTDCTNFTSVSNCWNPAFESNTILVASGLVVGNQYYLFIDGFSGDNCDFLFGAGKGVTVLPVKWNGVEALCEEGKTIITWKTMSEINNDYFSIERSEDGSTFKEVGKIKGSGSTTITSEYKFEDKELHNQISYYRIKQVDFDGKFEYSEMVSSSCISYESNKNQIFPNPFNDKINITLAKPFLSEFVVEINNKYGFTKYKKLMNTDNLSFDIELNSNIEPGVYIIMIHNNEQQIIEKITKL